MWKWTGGHWNISVEYFRKWAYLIVVLGDLCVCKLNWAASTALVTLVLLESLFLLKQLSYVLIKVVKLSEECFVCSEQRINSNFILSDVQTSSTLVLTETSIWLIGQITKKFWADLSVVGSNSVQPGKISDLNHMDWTTGLYIFLSCQISFFFVMDYCYNFRMCKNDNSLIIKSPLSQWST